MYIASKFVILLSIFLGVCILTLVSGGAVTLKPVFSHEKLQQNVLKNETHQTWKLGSSPKAVSTKEISSHSSLHDNNSTSTIPTLIPISQSVSRSRNGFEDRGALGLYIVGYLIKGCLYFYTYFKLICLCMGISLLFLLLCPLLPFLIPALILILLVAAGLSIAIPLIVTAVGGDEDLLLVTN